jgi:hypothetical protein
MLFLTAILAAQKENPLKINVFRGFLVAGVGLSPFNAATILNAINP